MEELFEGNDFSAVVTREQFNRLAHACLLPISIFTSPYSYFSLRFCSSLLSLSLLPFVILFSFLLLFFCPFSSVDAPLLSTAGSSRWSTVW